MDNSSPEYNSDEISLREVILKLNELKNEILGKWWLIAAFCILFSLIGILASILLTTNYEAKLSFVVDESDNKNPLGSYAGLASQFGFNMDGGGGMFNESNLTELLKSRRIVEQALLTPVSTEGEFHLLIDKYITFKKYKEKWKDHPYLMDFSYDFSGERSNYTVKHDSVISIIYTQIIENELTIEEVNNNATILEVTCTTENEFFSKYFAEYLVNSVSKFYIEHKTQKSRRILSFVQSRADSVRNELNHAELELAKWQDANTRLTKLEGSLEGIRLRRQVEILNVMYGEVIKNLEMSKMTLLNQTPLIQVIDLPSFPLTRNKLGLKKGLIFGLLTGGFLGCIFVIIRKVYKDTMMEAT